MKLSYILALTALMSLSACKEEKAAAPAEESAVESTMPTEDTANHDEHMDDSAGESDDSAE
jgi:hypothetical protein